MSRKNYALKKAADFLYCTEISKQEEWEIMLHYAILTDNIEQILINENSIQFWFKEMAVQSGELIFTSAIIFEFEKEN
jgi:hypothetical protein